MSPKPRTRIICTLGPATEDDDVLRQMIQEGMTVARLNFSHGSHEYHRSNIERVRRIAAELHTNVAILVDTRGPEIRTRTNEGHKPFQLHNGDHTIITTRDVEGTPACFSITYEALPDEVGPGAIIYVDDGLVGFEVDYVDGPDIHCRVTNGGEVGEHKGVNVPNIAMSLPSITDQDKDDMQFACQMDADAVAMSFVRDADAVTQMRMLCKGWGALDMLVFAKIECGLALNSIDDILAASDGIMVARGDLGVEIPSAEVPNVQKEIIAKCNRAYKPVITATQMLDSMIHNPRPTRAEVTDVANAIYDGTDCVMLSGETAAGAYPVEAVRMMAEVCRKTEEHLAERHEYHDRGGLRNVSGATSFAAVETAQRVGATAIVCPTDSGRTARIIAAFRPRLPIIATSPSERTVRRTCFIWGVEGLLTEEQQGLARTCYDAMRTALRNGCIQSDDIVIITAGDPLSSPITQGAETSTNVCMVAQALL